MEVTAIPLKNFVHGSLDCTEGKPILMQDGLARELERHGMVRVAIIPRRVDQALAVGSGAAVIEIEVGKAADDGQGQLSSLSHPAPLSPTPTSHVSKRGGGKHRKAGK